MRGGWDGVRVCVREHTTEPREDGIVITKADFPTPPDPNTTSLYSFIAALRGGNRVGSTYEQRANSTGVHGQRVRTEEQQGWARAFEGGGVRVGDANCEVHTCRCVAALERSTTARVRDHAITE